MCWESVVKKRVPNGAQILTGFWRTQPLVTSSQCLLVSVSVCGEEEVNGVTGVPWDRLGWQLRHLLCTASWELKSRCLDHTHIGVLA